MKKIIANPINFILLIALIFVVIGLFKIIEYPHRTWALISSMPSYDQKYTGRHTRHKYAFDILYSTEDGQIVEEHVQYNSSCRLRIESGDRIYIGYGKNKQGTYKTTFAYTIDNFFVIAGYFICLWGVWSLLSLALSRNRKKEDLIITIVFISMVVFGLIGMVLIIAYPRALNRVYKEFLGSMTIDFTNTVCLGANTLLIHCR